jgi:predicted nucleic acid-binding protein
VIVFDTNVLSEPMRPAPHPAVLAWMAEQEDVAITAVSVGELMTGARMLPHGARRERLLASIETILTGQDVLAYDEHAAHLYAWMRAERRATGRPLTVEDGMIAAITASHGATLATRNTRDFDGLGIDLVDPWAVTVSARDRGTPPRRG